MAEDEKPGRRRSAGMMSSPLDSRRARDGAPPLRAAKAEAHALRPSRLPRPEVLMGEAHAPRGVQTGAQREAFRAFMIANGLSPRVWAARADVPVSMVLAFLTGRQRALPPDMLEKLARAAGTTAAKLFDGAVPKP